MKQIRIFGIAGGIPLESMDADDFTDDKYTGRTLMRHPGGMMAVLMQSKEIVPYPWRIVYGFTALYFKTRKEALDYCHEHYYSYIRPRQLV